MYRSIIEFLVLLIPAFLQRNIFKDGLNLIMHGNFKGTTLQRFLRPSAFALDQFEIKYKYFSARTIK